MQPEKHTLGERGVGGWSGALEAMSTSFGRFLCLFLFGEGWLLVNLLFDLLHLSRHSFLFYRD
jgi:hypothetical protein